MEINIEEIKNPIHYNSHPSGIKCKEINADMPFFLGSCVKYIWRAGLKNENPKLKDLLKAKEYLLFEQERIDKHPGKRFEIYDESLVQKIEKVIESTDNLHVRRFYLKIIFGSYEISDLIECIDNLIKENGEGN